MYKNNLIEVFRITPTVDKYYETSEYTQKIGKYPDEKYYTINKPKYVGKYLKQLRSGYGDGCSIVDLFLNDETKEEVCVPLSYEGRTSYREVESKELEKRKKILSFMISSLENKFPINQISDLSNIGEKIFTHM